VAMHKLECTSAKVEQLASTRAISAPTNAWLNTDSPGHPYPCQFPTKSLINQSPYS
jgi:hypothetical protein